MQKKDIHNEKEVLEYWDRQDVESMYDKYLLKLEVELIKGALHVGDKILDAGCGEGEATYEYSKIKDIKIHAVDFSETRLNKARTRLSTCKNVSLKKVDFLKNYSLDSNYDAIVSQRFLINLMEWELQKKVLMDFISMLKKEGRLIILEGSMAGVNSLNNLRKLFGLPALPVKWHNLFFQDKELINLMNQNGMELILEEGLGEYFMLTRGIRPIFDKDLKWNSKFNEVASSLEIRRLTRLGSNFSRLKMWVFEKK